MNPTLKRQFKDDLFEQFARIGRALANPHRLELLELLAQGERSVEELAREASLSIANASQHLQTLRAAQLVTVRRQGVFAYYHLKDNSVFDLWHAVRTLGETHLAEVHQIADLYLHEREQFLPLRAEELLALLGKEDPVLVDVRPVIEYHAGHIAGARSIPMAELAGRLEELPRDQTIVAYCRGPYCVFADEAVKLLHAHGYPARRLADGFPEWRARGFPVALARLAYK